MSRPQLESAFTQREVQLEEALDEVERLKQLLHYRERMDSIRMEAGDGSDY